MKTLRELCLVAVAKGGRLCGQELPTELAEDIAKTERAIVAGMTGKGYYNYLEENDVSFNIGWKGGAWKMALMRSDRSTGSALEIKIRAGEPTLLSSRWTGVFGLGYSAGNRFGLTHTRFLQTYKERMEAFGHGYGAQDCRGLVVTDFNIDIEERKATFHGEYLTASMTKRRFATEFRFSGTGFYLRVKCMAMEKTGETYLTLTERCFEQPDTSSRLREQADNSLHDPPFHVPLYNKFYD